MAVDVNAIMNDINEDIRKKGYKDEDLLINKKDDLGSDLADYDYSIFCRRVEESLIVENEVLLSSAYNPEERGVRAFFKKVMRRFAKRCVLPMLIEIRKYDEESLVSEKCMFRIIREQQREINELKQRLSENYSK